MDKSTTSSPGATLLVVCGIQFINPFLMSSINVALPAIGNELHASAVQLSLTLTILILANAMLLLPMGRYADIHGRKKIFISGVVIIAISTLALAVVTSIYAFLFLRFIQGLGSAMILSTSLAILTSVFPAERRGRAMGIVVSMVYAGHSLGPTISGFIVDLWGWRWIFVVTFIWIMSALILALVKLKGEWKSAAGEPFDYLGATVFMTALFLIVTGASHLMDTPLAKWLLVVGFLCLALFIIIEWRMAYPLLNLRLLVENLEFSFSNLATFLNYAAISSFILLFSLYLQYVMGFSARHAGLIIVVQPLVQAALAPLAGRLSERYPPARIATLGMGICTIGIFAAANMDMGSSLGYLIFVLVLLGISLGLFSTPNMIVIMTSVGPKYLGVAASMVSTMRTTGTLLSATAIAVILSYYLGDAPVTKENVPLFLHCIRTSLYLFGFLSILGTLFSMAKGRLSGNIASRSIH